MKKTFTAFTLALVTVFGASFAQAGILISEAPSRDGIIVGDNRCNDTGRDGIIISDAPGIIISDAPGIIVGDFAEVIGGIIVGDYADPGCGTTTERAGILISD